MAEESDQERTEPASSRRLQKAREEGNVPRSKELGTLLILLAGVSMLWVTGGWMYQRMSGVVRHGFTPDRRQMTEPQAMIEMLHSQFQAGLTALAPILLVLLVAAVAGPIMIGGFNFSSQAMGFKASRLNPLSGLKRMVSLNGLVELVKAILKAIVVGGIGVKVVWSRSDQSIGLIGMPLEPGLASFTNLVLGAALTMVAGLAIIAMLDVPYQLWHYYSKLRMTKEELKQEHKQTEGDPHIKARIRQKQREMARRRMMQDVPTADVIVTNPTHYAVALRYEEGTMRAPRVVAKGTDLVAQQIREVGRANQVPLLEAPPLARALYRYAEIGDEVPAALYNAVAEVLAWVFGLRYAATQGVPPPAEPTDLHVPAALDPGAVPTQVPA
ncbi:MAG: flagellar biosynthesis protein FlhB [Betaproteobacteria bacterium]|nr:flagellar biosynthesis protein FlhB [Betaproteobacteria bacterium]